jgi:hypothetical protein
LQLVLSCELEEVLVLHEVGKMNPGGVVKKDVALETAA